MLIPWHYIAARFGKPFKAPEFKEREGKYVNLQRWEYNRFYIIFVLLVRSYISNDKFNKWLKKYRVNGDVGHYTYNLMMLMAATTYENTKSRLVLWAMRFFNKKYKQRYWGNAFFDFLCHLPYNEESDATLPN